MKAKLIDIIDNPDGSADAKFEMDDEALKFFAGEGIKACLLNYIKESNPEKKKKKKKK